MASNTNKKDWSAIVWALGWMLSLVHAIKDGAERLELPFAAFARLTSARGKRVIERILQIVREDYQRELAVRAEALEDHVDLIANLKAPATLLLPAMSSLQRIFPTYVHPSYASIRLLSIDALLGAPTKRGRIVMVRMGLDSEEDEVLAEMAYRRLRPLHPVEMIELWERMPDLGKDDGAWVALGAGAFPDEWGGRATMTIVDPGGKGRLNLVDSKQVWNKKTCFPAMSMEDEGE